MVKAGQKFIGLGHWVGWEFEVRAVEPETDERSGHAEIYTSKQPPCLLASIQGTLDHYRSLGYDVSERVRACTEPELERRELRWFVEWKRHGLIREIGG